MDQRSICLFLAMKGLSASEVHKGLVAVLGLEVIASSTVAGYLWQRQFPAIFPEPSDEPPTTIIDDGILEAINKQSFSSVRKLAKLTCIPTRTVCRRLTGSLGLVLNHLRCVPYTSTDSRKDPRVTLSYQPLLQLLSITHQGWHFVITPDESWFYLSTDHEQIWLRADQESPERPKHTIQDKKMMVTIAWNPLGFHLVEVPPKGKSVNAEYDRDNILTEPIRFRPEAGERHLVIHADNGRPHTAEEFCASCAEMDCGPPHIRRTPPISRHQTSSSSLMFRIPCKDSYLDQVRSCFPHS
jgi:hypothetical protein